LTSWAQAPAPPQFSWAPPGIDDVKPQADTQIPCPLADITAESSKRVQELVESMQRFNAKERVQFEEVGKDGQLHNVGSATFEYSAYIYESRPQQLVVDEFRNGSIAPQTFPSKLATIGTAALALIFHPTFVKDFSIECEGQADWKGHKAWVLRLQQSKENDFRGYRLANRYFRVMLKARAWIDAQSFEVLHLETNLREHIPEIPLELEQVSVDYGMVDFHAKDLQLWLPQKSDIYMDYRKRKYHYRHTFSDFQLFWVGTTEKVKKPKG